VAALTMILLLSEIYITLDDEWTFDDNSMVHLGICERAIPDFIDRFNSQEQPIFYAKIKFLPVVLLSTASALLSCGDGN
jgi:hypothetical protein